MSDTLFVPSGFRADVLMESDFPEPRYIVAGLLAEGSALLAGRPKIAKSWFALQLAIAVASGEPFLGVFPVEQGDAAYWALEDNPRRLKARMDILLNGRPAPKNLWLYTEWPRLDQGGLEAFDDWFTDHPDATYGAIDTLAKIKPHRPRNVEPYEHDHAVTSLTTKLAGDHRVGLNLIHHTRKAETDDFLDAVSGTLGLSGGTDATMVLKRSRGQADATLSITGRDVEEQELALSFDPVTCRWSHLGDAEAYRLSTARRDIVEVLVRVNEPMRPVDVSETLGKNRNTIRWHMAAMGKDGTLKAWDDGKYTVNGHNYEETRKHHQQAQHRNITNTLHTDPDGSVGDVGPVGDVGLIHKNGRAA